MILSRDFLKEILYYEVTHKENLFFEGYSTVFTIHFKKWYKIRKKISIPWICTEVDYDANTYSESREALELKRQLYNYFH